MKLRQIIEGKHDPHTRRAIFMIGGPGSGKTTIAKKLFAGTGVKHLNIDDIFSLLRSKHNVAGGYEPEMYKKAWQLTNRQFNLFTQGKLGIVIDLTGRRVDRLQEMKKELESLGYKTMAIFVNTSLSAALERNETRDRKVKPEVVKAKHKEVSENLGAIQRMFGDRLLIIDNTEQIPDLNQEHKVVQKFLQNNR